MKQKWFFLIGLLLGGVGLINGLSHACRFNVRDVGFVDLQSSPYRLYGVVNDQTPQDQQESLEQILFAALLDSNIQHEIVNRDQVPDYRALTDLPTESLSNPPFLLLVSPEERVLTMELPMEGKEFQNRTWSLVDSLVRSPVREKLLEELIHCYGILLLIYGENQKENIEAQKKIESALMKTKQNMGMLPKEIEQPPRLEILKREQLQEEKVLLWSFGYDVETDRSPAAVVLYGRGRMMGSFLKGEHIQEDLLLNYLSVIGLNCECGLDRSWMQGKMFPLHWDDSLRKRAAKQLTFDPESPMVKTEISQIIPKQSHARRSESFESRESMLLGYSEGSIDEMVQLDEITAKEATSDQEPMRAPLAEVVTSASPIHPSSTMNESQEASSKMRMKQSILMMVMAGVLVLLIGGGIFLASRRKMV